MKILMIINRVKKLKRSHPAFIDTLLSKLRSKLIISSLDGGNKNYEELFFWGSRDDEILPFCKVYCHHHHHHHHHHHRHLLGEVTEVAWNTLEIVSERNNLPNAITRQCPVLINPLICVTMQGHTRCRWSPRIRRQACAWSAHAGNLALIVMMIMMAMVISMMVMIFFMVTMVIWVMIFVMMTIMILVMMVK